MCLGCPNIIDRESFQQILSNQNPLMKVTSDFIRPDGDVDLNDVCTYMFHSVKLKPIKKIIPDLYFTGRYIFICSSSM